MTQAPAHPACSSAPRGTGGVGRSGVCFAQVLNGNFRCRVLKICPERFAQEARTRAGHRMQLSWVGGFVPSLQDALFPSTRGGLGAWANLVQTLSASKKHFWPSFPRQLMPCPPHPSSIDLSSQELCREETESCPQPRAARSLNTQSWALRWFSAGLLFALLLAAGRESGACFADRLSPGSQLVGFLGNILLVLSPWSHLAAGSCPGRQSVEGEAGISEQQQTAGAGKEAAGGSAPADCSPEPARTRGADCFLPAMVARGVTRWARGPGLVALSARGQHRGLCNGGEGTWGLPKAL